MSAAHEIPVETEWFDGQICDFDYDDDWEESPQEAGYDLSPDLDRQDEREPDEYDLLYERSASRIPRDADWGEGEYDPLAHDRDWLIGLAEARAREHAESIVGRPKAPPKPSTLAEIDANVTASLHLEAEWQAKVRAATSRLLPQKRQEVAEEWAGGAGPPWARRLSATEILQRVSGADSTSEPTNSTCANPHGCANLVFTKDRCKPCDTYWRDARHRGQWRTPSLLEKEMRRRAKRR